MVRDNERYNPLSLNDRNHSLTQQTIVFASEFISLHLMERNGFTGESYYNSNLRSEI